MKFIGDGFDVWLFQRNGKATRYLLLQASREKAERWFGGSQFWQVPSDFVGERNVVSAIDAELASLEIKAGSIWAAEYAYTIYNPRYEAAVSHTVFAAEAISESVRLGSGHAAFRWCDIEEAKSLLQFRGLLEGLDSVRQYVSEPKAPMPALRLR